MTAVDDSSVEAPAEFDDGIDEVEKAWHRERPDLDVSSVGIISRIWRVARHLENERKARLADLGTDRVTVDVLAMLRRAGAPYRRTAGELTHSSLITPGGVSQRLDKLEKAGLITRQIHPHDRRRIDVELTDDGKLIIDEVLAELMAHESSLLEVLGAEDQAHLRRILKIFLAQFEGHEGRQ